PADFSTVLNYIASFKAVISGRFHGACMAIMLGKPLAVTTSNTWKTETMLRDIGLDESRVVNGRIYTVPVPYSPREREAISQYLATARTTATRAFDQILE